MIEVHVRSEKEGEDVGVRIGQTWIPAVVTEKHSTPRSYVVTTHESQTYRRNPKF